MIRGLLIALLVAACAAPPPPSAEPAPQTPSPAVTVGASAPPPTDAPTPEPTAEPTPPPSTEPTAERLTFEATGSRVTRPFDLPFGEYLVEWNVQRGGDCYFVAELESIGTDEIVSPAIFSEELTGQVLNEIEGGRYSWAVEPDNCGQWTITMERLS